MTAMPSGAAARFHAVVLAGERPGGGTLARQLGLPAGVLAVVAGKTCLTRVIEALRTSAHVSGGVICGPAAAVAETAEPVRRLLAPGDFRWLAPASGPAASALAAARQAGGYPVLLTGGDHALLDAAMVDTFCSRALAQVTGAAPVDLLVGLVPHAVVAAAFPQSRRTVLHFADGAFCGSNLFALLNERSERALMFWSAMEADRKRPWKIARRLGGTTLVRYLAGRLTVADAFAVLSDRAGCRIGWAEVPQARAAVDVDCHDDWLLANRLLEADQIDGGPSAARHQTT
jgi:molybdopterin-guanine dinucleotide biosynthesis protein A